MVRNSFALIGRDLVRDNGQAVIQLHGIAVDDLAIEADREVDSQLPEVVSR